MEQKNFFKDAPLSAHIVFFISAILMIGFSIYLTSHYYEMKYPTGLGSSSLCDINSFFTCDAATNSPASNIAGVPISLFGILVGVLSLFGYLFPSDNIEKTNLSILGINAIGCIFLFIYSLVALGTLCPFCSLYYVCSISAFVVAFKHSGNPSISLIPLGTYGAIALVMSTISYNYAKEKDQKMSQASLALIKAYDELNIIGVPKFDSDYRIASTGGEFKDAPIQITKFSDFECPACKALSDVLSKLAQRYQGKINIQYFFYPLDTSCNASMERVLHKNACHAAYLASCLPKKFAEIEHEIFANQGSLSADYINRIAKRENVEACVNDKETKKKVIRYLDAAKPFNVRSTPTFILNGKKIEGSLPLSQMVTLIDHLLEKAKK